MHAKLLALMAAVAEWSELALGDLFVALPAIVAGGVDVISAEDDADQMIAARKVLLDLFALSAGTR